jgi:hypothetical protein
MENIEDEIINKVATSSLVTFDLEDYYSPGDRVLLDIKDQLYQGLILKERDFRTYIKMHDWSVYRGKYVAITCSADAIVPTWAYMLLVIALQPHVRHVIFGTLESLEESIYLERLREVDWNQFKDAKVVIKGCSKVNVPVSIYVLVTARIRPFAASLMFGEPCSTVPLFKRSKL